MIIENDPHFFVGLSPSTPRLGAGAGAGARAGWIFRGPLEVYYLREDHYVLRMIFTHWSYMCLLLLKDTQAHKFIPRLWYFPVHKITRPRYIHDQGDVAAMSLFRLKPGHRKAHSFPRIGIRSLRAVFGGKGVPMKKGGNNKPLWEIGNGIWVQLELTAFAANSEQYDP